MTDIVERLFTRSRRMGNGRWLDREAAAEIERLRSENTTTALMNAVAKIKKLEAEIERLQLVLDMTEGELKNSHIEIERLEELIADRFEVKMKMAERIKELEAEIERLRKLLQIVDDNGQEKDQLAAEVERLEAEEKTQMDQAAGLLLENASLRDEIERLRDVIERLRGVNGTLSDALTEAQTEVEQLKTG